MKRLQRGFTLIEIMVSMVLGLPGMPAEVFISTEERTAASYLVKPFTDQMNRAFRER